jgi:multiple sugar transport system substrate-binding protein
MDNSPKDNSEENKQTSGDIFSSSTESAYQEAATLENQPPDIYGQDAQTTVSQPSESPINTLQNQSPLESGYSLENGASNPPPPFIEDKRKKYIFIAAGAILFILIMIAVVSFLFRKPSRPAEKITLNYWGLWEEKELMQPAIDEYIRAHPNITVNYIKQDPKQYRERLQAAIERDEGPDIYRFHNTWTRMMLSYLAPMPKTVYSDSDYEKTFYPVTTDDLKISGNYYGIPLMIDGLLLFYNEDILKSANVPVPSTWVDVQKAVPKLTVKEKGKIITSAIALGTAENISHFSDILGLMMLQNGTQLNKSFFSCADKNSSTCAVETLTFYRQFADKPNNSWDETLDDSIVAFAGGKVAMIFAPSWQFFTIKELAKNTNLNFKTAPVPQLPCANPPCLEVNWATYWVEGVSSKSKNKEASWEFLKYLSQASTMQKLYSEQIKYRKFFGEPYSRIDLGKSLSSNPYLAPLISEAPTMKSFYFASRTYDGETGINSTLIKYLKDAVNKLSQGVSVETALKTADDGLKQVLSRFGITTAAQ